MISNIVKQDESHDILLEDHYSEFHDILNKMIRFDPDKRPSVTELIEVFGNLM